MGKQTTTRTITPERAANEIRRAYGVYCLQYRAQQGQENCYMPIVEIAYRCDLLLSEITEGVRHLIHTGDWGAIPESNQKLLTAEERQHEIWIGNQRKHYLIKY